MPENAREPSTNEVIVRTEGGCFYPALLDPTGRHPRLPRAAAQVLVIEILLGFLRTGGEDGGRVADWAGDTLRVQDRNQSPDDLRLFPVQEIAPDEDGYYTTAALGWEWIITTAEDAVPALTENSLVAIRLLRERTDLGTCQHDDLSAIRDHIEGETYWSGFFPLALSELDAGWAGHVTDVLCLHSERRGKPGSPQAR